MGGDSGPSVPNIETRSIGDIYGGAVDASISQLPRLLQAFSQYGPEYASTLADIFITNQQRQKEAFPEKYAVLQPLSESLATGLNSINAAGGQAIPETLRVAALNNIRGGQAARGIAESPVSALSEAQYLGALGESYRNSITGQALQFINSDNMIVPGSEIEMANLGLQPASLDNLSQQGTQLEGLRLENEWATYDAELGAWARDMERQRANAQALGMVSGMGGGAIYGAANGIGAGQGATYGMKGAQTTLSFLNGGGGGTYF